jgi:NADH:ubiquinone oxidoreductase subunit 6 (subunit J)
MMLGLNFIGLSYLLVYVGAVSILFLFILMLINVRISELSTDSSNSVPLALVIGVVFTITIYNIIPYNVIRNSIPNTEHTYLDLNVLSKYVNIYDHKDVSFVSTHI